MARPKSKEELLDLSQINFDRLNDYIAQLSEEEQQQEFPGVVLNRNIRDVWMHLHHWHLLTMNWYELGMEGIKAEMPAKGYTWKTLPALNQWIQNKYVDVSLEEAKRSLNTSHKQLRAIMKAHSNEELFEKKRYKWTGSTSMGAYLVSATSSHYDWAFKLIKKAKK